MSTEGDREEEEEEKKKEQKGGDGLQAPELTFLITI